MMNKINNSKNTNSKSKTTNKKQKKNKDNGKIGRIGEYLVAAELEQNGLSVSMTIKNFDSFDIFAINDKSLKTYAIQVKTTYANSWILNKSKIKCNNNSYFVFVKLYKNSKNVEYYVVSSFDVYKKCSNSKSKNPTWHETNNKYFNAWGTLK